jgi:hypothetical protein
MKPIVLIVAVLLASASRSSAQPTFDEFICESKGSQAVWKLAAAEAICVVVCQREVRAGSTDASECVRPFSGQTQGCVNGAQGKAGGRIGKACNPDQPECYTGANCEQIGDDLIPAIEAQLDPLLAAAYCDDSGSPDGLTAAEGRCEDAVAKYLGAFLARKARCLAKCHSIEFKSGVATGTYCSGGSVNDPTGKTQACIDSLQLKVQRYIDRGCDAVAYAADPPECHNGRTAADWVALGESAVDGQDPSLFCEQ